MFFEMVQDLRKQADQKSASAGQGAVPVSSEASAAHGAVLAASGGVSHAAPAAVLSAGSAAHAGPSAAPTLHPDRATENKQWLKVLLCLDKIFFPNVFRSGIFCRTICYLLFPVSCQSWQVQLVQDGPARLKRVAFPENVQELRRSILKVFNLDETVRFILIAIDGEDTQHISLQHATVVLCESCH